MHEKEDLQHRISLFEPTSSRSGTAPWVVNPWLSYFGPHIELWSSTFEGDWLLHWCIGFGSDQADIHLSRIEHSFGLPAMKFHLHPNNDSCIICGLWSRASDPTQIKWRCVTLPSWQATRVCLSQDRTWCTAPLRCNVDNLSSSSKHYIILDVLSMNPIVTALLHYWLLSDMMAWNPPITE